jgi:CRP-like cAMP-binding protein/Na+-translocating ferredoxin:NAD+ oxidoreductase RNF subunit RnfB
MTADPTAGIVQLTLDGRPVVVPSGSTVLDAARTLGLDVPVLCHAPDQAPVGVCRVCMVEVKGARALAAACVRGVEAGMEVQTSTDRVLRARRTVYEMLLADHPSPCLRQRTTQDCELETLATRAGVLTPRFAPPPLPRPVDDSSPIIRVELDACILCDRCVRGCSDTRHNFVIGRIGKGATTRIGFDDDAPMGRSTCVGCGECMVSCPTGALTNKRAVEAGRSPDASMRAEELLELPMFSGISGTFLELNRGSVVKRHLRPGEVICNEGEYGSTAFYILRGEVEVSIAAPLGHVQSDNDQARTGVRNFLRRLTSLTRSESATAGRSRPAFIPIDSSVDVPYETRVARLGAGEIFGEMACLSHYPRSATVRAAVETEVLEMFGNVLYMLQKNKRFKAELDRRYRERALHNHLKSIQAFADLPEAVIDELCDQAELLRYEPGEVICRQDDPADAFFLVRIGFVKVSERFPGGDMVLAYLARGSYFGEIGLLRGGVRTATCAALDHVEVVRVSGDDFAAILARSPELSARLSAEADARLAQNRARHARVSTVPLDDFIAQGLMQAQNLLLLDLERCTRCDLCVRACAEAHDGVTRLVRDGLRFDKYLVATSCRSCRDPLCMIGCPVSSIRRRDSLEIVIEDWCIGCGLCAQNCPYGNINLHPFTVQVADETRAGRMRAVVREKATTCDLSRQFKEPACVYACPHGAAMRVDPHEFFADRLGLAP